MVAPKNDGENKVDDEEEDVDIKKTTIHSLSSSEEKEEQESSPSSSDEEQEEKCGKQKNDKVPAKETEKQQQQNKQYQKPQFSKVKATEDDDDDAANALSKVVPGYVAPFRLSTSLNKNAESELPSMMIKRKTREQSTLDSLEALRKQAMLNDHPSLSKSRKPAQQQQQQKYSFSSALLSKNAKTTTSSAHPAVGFLRHKVPTNLPSAAAAVGAVRSRHTSTTATAGSEKFKEKQARPSPAQRRQQQKKKKEQRNDAGEGWFHIRATPMTAELQQDIQLLKNRNALDPKRFYKSLDVNKKRNNFVQVGTVVEGASEYYSARLTKKQRRTNLVDEVLADKELSSYATARFQQQNQARVAKRTQQKFIQSKRKKSVR